MASPMSPGTGALHDNLPTPPASSVAPSHHPSPLPQPRRHPLRPGGPKESELITYLDHGVNNVQKRCDDRFKNRRTYTAFADGHGGHGEHEDVKAYRTFWEAAKDIEGLVDVIWVSGSPNLQIPYLLNMAVMISEFLPLFKPAPRATFRLLDKLDAAFSSLLQGKDADSGEPLPGFENGRSISTTYKVRLKGIVERTRLTVMRVMSGENEGDEDEPAETDESMDEDVAEETDRDVDGVVKFEGFDNDEDDDWEEIKIAGVYEQTIGELGDVLGGPPIGIITDD